MSAAGAQPTDKRSNSSCSTVVIVDNLTGSEWAWHVCSSHSSQTMAYAVVHVVNSMSLSGHEDLIER